MAVLTAPSIGRVPETVLRGRRRPGAGDGPVRKALVVVLVAASAGAHGIAAASATGAMAWMMAGMGLACATCLVHLWRGGCAVRTAARHLLAMCAVMALFHMAWLASPLLGGHHQHGPGGTASASASGGAAGHGEAMLGVIGVELICLAGATAMLRTGGGERLRSDRIPSTGRLSAASIPED